MKFKTKKTKKGKKETKKVTHLDLSSAKLWTRSREKNENFKHRSSRNRVKSSEIKKSRSENLKIVSGVIQGLQNTWKIGQKKFLNPYHEKHGSNEFTNCTSPKKRSLWRLEKPHGKLQALNFSKAHHNGHTGTRNRGEEHQG
jgi:hypothetical protein